MWKSARNCKFIQYLFKAEDNKNKHQLILLIKELWSKSGNAISKLYAGTNSSTTKLSKHGGNGFTGLLQNGITGI